MTDKELLSRVERSPGQRAGYKQLVRELGLGGGRERRLLREQLDRLAEDGRLIRLNSEHWALASSARSRNAWVDGRLDLHRDGFGFVRPESPDRDVGDDIFIPPNALEGAMHGDRVRVELTPSHHDGRGPGRRSGRVARILVRHHPTVVGIFHSAQAGRGGQRIGSNYVTPLDARVGEAVLILPGGEIPVHSVAADRVIGRESMEREIHPRTPADLEGLVVDVAIVDWPTSTRPARGRVIEVLGKRDAFGVDVEILIRKHHLPHVFPDRVLEEARAVAKPPSGKSSPAPGLGSAAGSDAREAPSPRRPSLPFSRRDFRGLPIVTIDGETARDFDDAVLVRDLPGGEFELQVHIADVAQYVRPGTALDLEARMRGNSVYFPDRAIPMLPLELSADVCSLRPDEDRFVLSCVMRLGPEGEILSSELSEGLIRSVRRMTYTEVHAILSGDSETREKFADLVPEFERMYRLARLLNTRRERRGSIDFDLPEPVIQFDERGQMSGIIASERTWAHRLIEEFMLAANESVAGWIEGVGVPSLYRIHEKPDARRVASFEEIAGRFGYSLGVGPLPVKRVELRGDRRERMRRGSGERKLREIPENIQVTPQMYQKLAARLVGKPEERILTYLMLRSLKQARYSEKNEGHFALATPCYTHFTSPIRRYPDLVVHRIVKTLLDSGVDGHREIHLERAVSSRSSQARAAIAGVAGHPAKPPEGISVPVEIDELAAIAQETSQTERRAADAERELIEWKKVRFMQDKIGDEFSGIVVNVAKFGLFVELDDLFIEGLVPIGVLPGGRYRFNEYSRQILGEAGGRRFSVGDRIQVILDRIDSVENKLQFSLAEDPSLDPQNPSRGKATRPDRPHPKNQGRKVQGEKTQGQKAAKKSKRKRR